MRLFLATLSTATLLMAGAAQAAGEPYAPDKPQQSMAQDKDTVVGAARTPLKDLNIDKKDIPDVLIAAEADPYDHATAGSCEAISIELDKLSVALGPDFDEPGQAEADPRVTTGGLAKVGVQALIPFRGAIRYVSGADAHDKDVARAVDAGAARRGFLKGLAKEKNCDGSAPPPAAVVEAKAVLPEPAAPTGPPAPPNIGMTLVAPVAAAAPPPAAEPAVAPLATIDLAPAAATRPES